MNKIRRCSRQANVIPKSVLLEQDEENTSLIPNYYVIIKNA